jgi:hypothetical protein
MITAYVRLQACVTNDRRAFISRNVDTHGTAKGPIDYYEVSGATWNAIRGVLRAEHVIGVTGIRYNTVQGHWEGPGEILPFRKIDLPEVPPEFRHSLRPGCFRYPPCMPPVYNRARGLDKIYRATFGRD